MSRITTDELKARGGTEIHFLVRCMKVVEPDGRENIWHHCPYCGRWFDQYLHVREGIAACKSCHGMHHLNRIGDVIQIGTRVYLEGLVGEVDGVLRNGIHTLTNSLAKALGLLH